MNNAVRGILAAIGASVVVAFILSHLSSGGSSSASQGCNARSCVITTVQQALIGTAAKDGSAITGMTCQPSTIRQNAGDTWTVSCVTSYSDNSRWDGYATVVVSQNDVTWEPTTQAG